VNFTQTEQIILMLVCAALASSCFWAWILWPRKPKPEPKRCPSCGRKWNNHCEDFAFVRELDKKIEAIKGGHL